MSKNIIIGEKYEIVSPLNKYGETILYLGRDINSGNNICIREFFSESIMSRNSDGIAAVKPGCEVKYKSLSMDYEELCGYMMGIPEGYPLIRPLEMFKTNNTVYYIEEYVDTESFDDYLARKGGSVNWQQLKRMITPLVKLLSKMHSDGVYHRGLSPETVLVTKDQNLLLSGFSIPAARTAESELNATLYFGYSAPEQYSSSSWQGSWSDVYSFAALCYRALTGVIPVEWRHRGEGIKLKTPREINPNIPQNVSDALMKALSVDLSHRYRQIEELWCDMLVIEGGGTVTYKVPIVKRTDEETAETGKKIDIFKQPIVVALIALTFISVFAIAFAYRIADIYILPADEDIQAETVIGEPNIIDNSLSEVEDTEPEIVIPNLTGTDIEKVILDPLYNNLFTFQIERVFSETQSAGVVVAQRPLPGEPIQSNTEHIYLWVSKGSELIAMPDLIGLSLEEASRMMEMSDIKFSITFVPAESNDGGLETGTILETSIPAHEIVYRNSAVVELMAAEVIESNTAQKVDDYQYITPPRVVQYWPPVETDSDD